MSKKHLFWVDLEMTGLDENVHHILEIAAVITDLELKPVKEYHQVIYQPKEVLSQMDDWCTKTHTASGLVELIPKGAKIEDADLAVCNLLSEFFGSKEKVVLTGNSVGNDKRFIDKYMPKTALRLHYRIIDISSFKEIFRDKYGIKFEKKNAHRAVDDIYESIRELNTYLSFIKIGPEEK